MEYYNPEDKKPHLWGAISVGAYALLLTVAMLTIKFSVAAEDPLTQGILLDFGESPEGEGLEELEATDTTATPPQEQSQESEESIESDQRSDVEVEQKKIEEPQHKETTQREQPVEQPDTTVVEERKVDINALFPGMKEQSSAKSQGTTQNKGNQGTKGGVEGGAAEGSADQGGEIIADLKDRSVVGSTSIPQNHTNETGKIVVEILVNEKGVVTSASYRSQGSTINNSELTTKAEAAARKTNFTPSDNFIQRGTITYIYKVN